MSAPFILKLHVWKKDSSVTNPFSMMIDGASITFPASDFETYDTRHKSKVIEIPCYRGKKYPVTWHSFKDNIAIYPYLPFEGFYAKSSSMIDYICLVESITQADSVGLQEGSTPPVTE